VITVPTITIGNGLDGIAADGRGSAESFSGTHEHRVLDGAT
jgi:hypothetical protein